MKDFARGDVGSTRRDGQQKSQTNTSYKYLMHTVKLDLYRHLLLNLLTLQHSNMK